MSAIFKLELRRAFTTRFYFCSVAVAVVLGIVAAVGPIQNCLETNRLYLTEEYLAYHHVYQFAFTSAWAQWLPMRGTDAVPNLFFFTAPLLIASAYSWSFRSDQAGGYAQVLMVNTTRFRYYAAKACASFIAGGSVVAVSLVANFLVVACFIPLQSPDILYRLYTGISTSMFLSQLFFTNPALYFLARLVLDFVLGGLWATAVLAFSLLVRNRVAVVALPYIFLIAVKYVSENIYTLLNDPDSWVWNLTIIDHLKAMGDGFTYNGWALACDAAILFAFSVVVPLAMRRRDAL